MIDALTLRGLEDPDFGGNQPSLGSWSKTVSPNFAQNAIVCEVRSNLARSLILTQSTALKKKSKLSKVR